MTSAQRAPLPLFYKELMPITTTSHRDARFKAIDNADFFRDENAVPVTVDEFLTANRFYPIVFTLGDDPVPVALMSMQPGSNAFVDQDGKVVEKAYVPAYIRRYPFLLARLHKDAKELSLCIDPTANAIGSYDDGEQVFEEDEPSAATKNILKFCEEYEAASQRTSAFVAELQKLDLLIAGEATVSFANDRQSHFQGFQMVDEQKLCDLRGDQLRTLAQSGALPMIYAHLLSLRLIPDVVARQDERAAALTKADAETVETDNVEVA